MEFGLFHEFQQAPGEGPARAFAQSFEQVDAAEAGDGSNTVCGYAFFT